MALHFNPAVRGASAQQPNLLVPISLGQVAPVQFQFLDFYDLANLSVTKAVHLRAKAEMDKIEKQVIRELFANNCKGIGVFRLIQVPLERYISSAQNCFLAMTGEPRNRFDVGLYFNSEFLNEVDQHERSLIEVLDMWKQQKADLSSSIKNAFDENESNQLKKTRKVVKRRITENRLEKVNLTKDARFARRTFDELSKHFETFKKKDVRFTLDWASRCLPVVQGLNSIDLTSPETKAAQLAKEQARIAKVEARRAERGAVSDYSSGSDSPRSSDPGSE